MAERANPGNYQLAARQFLRALRGPRSQRAFAKRLGYRANPITDWEHGRRCPSAQEGLRAAEKVGLDVRAAFVSFHPVPLEQTNSAAAIAAWLEAIRGSTPIARIAERTGSSRFAVRRWLTGTGKPNLVDFFSYVDAVTGRLHDLVAALVPIELVPALAARRASAEALRSAAYVAPWSEAVLRVIETAAYRALPKHRPGVIAAELGITLADERIALDVLTRAGTLRKQRGRYLYVDDDTVDTRGDRERVTQLLTHWSHAASTRVADRGPEDLFAYNVFALSQADLGPAREILRRAYRELRTLVAASTPLERVALVNVQLVAFGTPH